MDRDFFIKLTLGTYRVTDLAAPQGPEKGEIRSLANSVLARLILFSETNPVTQEPSQTWQEQKQSLAPKIQEEIDSLVRHFGELRGRNEVNEKNFLILEKEYQRITEWLNEFAVAKGGTVPPRAIETSIVQKKREDDSLSERQRKIMGILQNKEKTQVWELQKVLTEVTKRTLRRDLDDLLQHNLIERKGEWNTVFYELKR